MYLPAMLLAFNKLESPWDALEKNRFDSGVRFRVRVRVRVRVMVRIRVSVRIRLE